MQDRCAICGEIIPEGGIICRKCLEMSPSELKLRKSIITSIHRVIQWEMPKLGDHCERVAELSRRVASYLGAGAVEEIYCAALVHDVGKLFISPAI